ncbi:DegT/DnrJ/EryC1/StrS family aminotransferase [Planococcus sp. CAU13]|uniref:DegT/DnrJ/EryC1/StrS family aminotransferase n=1 Tax=Planococcus sp. CAU13 TaxID=1541197 RepID=UPI00068CCD3D|nr:aminotransferase class I/II-fold pyridoxal phosphate-dependent enzyme [Planococcus sp. CAU13]
MKILPFAESAYTAATPVPVKEETKIFLSSPHMTGNEMKYIEEAFRSNWIAPMGPNVDRFEKELAAFTGVEAAAALSSGTAAIHLALDLIGVKQGDTVFCASLTFVASANPILYLGAEPVFIDSEEDTWNMSPRALRRALDDALAEGRLPKAVIVVNLYGQSAKMDELVAICNEYKVPVIEDAAESLGSRYKGKASGSIGKFGIYSFNGNKIITASGGGMLVSNSAHAIQKARFLSSQAKDNAPFYKHSEVGYNYRMSNVLAGIGRAQLEAIDERVAARRAVYERYEKELGDLPAVSFQPEPEESFSNRWLTVMLLDPAHTRVTPHRLKRALEAENIEARYVWKPLHTQKLFEAARFYPHERKNAVSEKLFKNGLCLPSGSNMTYEDQTRVIQAIRKMLP